MRRSNWIGRITRDELARLGPQVQEKIAGSADSLQFRPAPAMPDTRVSDQILRENTSTADPEPVDSHAGNARFDADGVAVGGDESGIDGIVGQLDSPNRRGFGVRLRSRELARWRELASSHGYLLFRPD